MTTLNELVAEYDRAVAYTGSLWQDLTPDEVVWRESDEASAICWHLGHQAAVAHFMVRNLTAAEPSPDPELDELMDSATAERDRGDLPDLARLGSYRDAVAERLRFRIGTIDSGNVGAPTQLRVIAKTLVTAVVNHEYQHSKWIGEVRSQVHNKELPPRPQSELLVELDGYLVLQP